MSVKRSFATHLIVSHTKIGFNTQFPEKRQQKTEADKLNEIPGKFEKKETLFI
jgi:hypothetical protein